jgi:chloramphenicol-sensitive protein RarD
LSDTPPSQFRSGLIYGLVAYTCWGAVPLYFAEVKGVPAAEILSHRIAWSFPLMLLVTALTPGGVAALRAVLRSRKLILLLLVSALFLAGNWLLYIYATVNGRVAEASVGYYALPLVNAFLATVFLGERLRPLHYPALALIVIGVMIPLTGAGSFPWLAVVLPVTFGIYGLLRKQMPVDSVTGLTMETLLLLAPSVGFILYMEVVGTGAFGRDWNMNALLAFGGVITVVPLLTFMMSLRRLPLLTQALIQFISPSVQFLLAVTVLKEQMGPEQWAAIGCVWASVGVFIADAVVRSRTARRARRELLRQRELELVGVVRTGGMTVGS